MPLHLTTGTMCVLVKALGSCPCRSPEAFLLQTDIRLLILGQFGDIRSAAHEPRLRHVAVLFVRACSIVAAPLLHPQNDSFGKSWRACVGSADGCLQLNGRNKCECENNGLVIFYLSKSIEVLAPS